MTAPKARPDFHSIQSSSSAVCACTSEDERGQLVGSAQRAGRIYLHCHGGKRRRRHGHLRSVLLQPPNRELLPTQPALGIQTDSGAETEPSMPAAYPIER